MASSTNDMDATGAPPTSSNTPSPTPSNQTPSTTADMTTMELRAHLEALPQELYDLIRALTFTPTTNAIVRVVNRPLTLVPARHHHWLTKDHCDESYHDPPLPFNLMQVSSATRAQYITDFYNSTTFIASDLYIFYFWALHMPETMQKQVRNVKVLDCWVAPAWKPSCLRENFCLQENWQGCINFIMSERCDERSCNSGCNWGLTGAHVELLWAPEVEDE